MTTSLSAWQRDRLDGQYRLLCDLVFRLTHTFARKYAIPFDDLIGPAHVAYVKAYERYDGTKGAKLSSWIHTKVWYALMSFVRKELTHRTRFGYGSEVLVADLIREEDDRGKGLPTTPPNLYRLEVESELSPAACTVVQLLLETRRDFALMFQWETAKAHRVTRRHLLKCLREHLTDLGWSRVQITAAFQEIRGTLNR